MKKKFLCLALLASMAAAAQSKKNLPPPPPPAPAPPVAAVHDIPPPPPPAPPAPPYPKDYAQFLTRNPSVESVHWHNNAILITTKDGKVDRYVLNDKGVREAEARYGKLPVAPPPPPKPPRASKHDIQ